MTAMPVTPYMMVNDMANACKAFGDPQRLKILRILASRQVEALCVTDIAKILHVSQPAISQHINMLKKIGVVMSTKVGNRVHYGIDAKKLDSYRAKFDAFFLKGFTPCPYNISRCSECPKKETCA
jgi:DNA-binding transcriptional ArsR family regulator